MKLITKLFQNKSNGQCMLTIPKSVLLNKLKLDKLPDGINKANLKIEFDDSLFRKQGKIGSPKIT